MAVSNRTSGCSAGNRIVMRSSTPLHTQVLTLYVTRKRWRLGLARMARQVCLDRLWEAN